MAEIMKNKHSASTEALRDWLRSTLESMPLKKLYKDHEDNQMRTTTLLHLSHGNPSVRERLHFLGGTNHADFTSKP